jgi:signal transduction histidine kinase/ligand-binding sensor domain-containing protein/DNA-binding response OmpR family regulator
MEGWYKSTLFIVYVFAALAMSPASAQDQLQYELNFRELEGMHGRPLGKIRNISQDPFGYMWFSGEEEKCIYRYDGIKLTLYRRDYSDPNSLGGVDINAVYADPTGLIWVGFMNNGMDLFDPVTNIFKHYRHDEKNEKSIASDYVGAVLKDSRGRVWVGTNKGLDLLNVETGEFTHYKNDSTNATSLSHDFVLNIYEDRQGTIWVATAGWPWITPVDGGGLNRLEQDGTFTRYQHDPEDEHSLISNKVLALYEDSRGVFWVGTGGDGLHTFDRKTGRFQRHLYDPSQPLKLSRPPLKTNAFCKAVDFITFITEDHSGAIWIGSVCSGVNRYDPESGIITRYENSNGFPDNSSWNGFVSRDGVLWIATQQNKLYRVNPVRNVIETSRLGTGVSRFVQNDDGTMWVAAEKSLALVDTKGNLLKKIAMPGSNGEPLRVIEVHRDAPNILWLGTSQGVYVIDTRTEEYHPIDLGFDAGATIRINRDKVNPDLKWITSLNGGLIKYSKQYGVVKRYTNNQNTPESIFSNHTIYVTSDKDHVWVTTTEGVSRLDKKSNTFKNYLTLKGTFVYTDSRDVIWVGSENGLYKYDAANDRFTLAEYHSVITTARTYGIVEDDQSNLWIATPSSVVRIDSPRETISQFGIEDGIRQNSVTAGAIYKTAEGKVLVGHDEGYYVIDPLQFSEVEKPPRVLITGFLINDGGDLFNSTNLLKTPVDEVAPLKLSYDQNSFSIGFMMADYRDPHGNHFQARLLGFDDVWRDLVSQNSSTFVGVPPGTYTYELRGYTNRGSVTNKSFSIIIAPPWWKTWWAYGCYALLVVALLIGARKMIIRDERMKANFQLEHLNFEKAKEVDRVKTSFFTNISHEFRTPLTLITGPVQELLEKYANDPRTSEKLKLIQRNSDLLLKLINQLLDLARMEAGSLKVEKTESDIYSFIRVISNSFESFARQKGVSLSVEVPLLIKPVVYDKDKLETILINLINNAIKFTPPGGSVHLRARVEESILLLSVRDTGIGISKENQTKIFERFHQVSEAHKEVGTGIGLSLVKDLVGFMHGTIEVNSDEGRGSEFIVSLPIQFALDSSIQPLEISQPKEVEMGLSSIAADKASFSNGQYGKHSTDTKPHILVVEDNADVRGFIISCLGDEYNFLEADNGKVGLDKALAEIPDMIISDVMMPEMDGIKMTEKVKADIRTSHIPLILLTAKSTEDSKMHGLQTGADDYLTKPFNKNELLLKVRNGISRQQKLREKLKAELMSAAPRIDVMSQDERFLNKVKQKILERLADEQLSVESLGEDIGLSRSQLLRKVSALTGMSVNELIRKLRLQRAAQLIEQNWGPVSQVAYEVGFPNPSYFAKMFKEEFGVLPSEYFERIASRT